MCHKTTRNKSMKGYMRHARQHNGMRFFAFFIHHFSYQDLDFKDPNFEALQGFFVYVKKVSKMFIVQTKISKTY